MTSRVVQVQIAKSVRVVPPSLQKFGKGFDVTGKGPRDPRSFKVNFLIVSGLFVQVRSSSEVGPTRPEVAYVT